MILLGCILDKGRWSCFLVLGGMRLCVLIFFFFQMNCKIFHMNNRQDMYDCMFLKPLVGLEHLFQKWDLKHSQMRKYGRRVGRAGEGWDTASGTMD